MARDPASLQTAASKVRFLGTARSGTQDTWHLRVTSIALVPLTIAFVCVVLSLVGKDYEGVRATLGQPFPALLMLLFILTGVSHMKVGMQAIIDDYVHDTHLKDWSMMANLFFSVCVGLACVYAVLKISFI